MNKYAEFHNFAVSMSLRKLIAVLTLILAGLGWNAYAQSIRSEEREIRKSGISLPKAFIYEVDVWGSASSISEYYGSPGKSIFCDGGEYQGGIGLSSCFLKLNNKSGLWCGLDLGYASDRMTIEDHFLRTFIPFEVSYFQLYPHVQISIPYSSATSFFMTFGCNCHLKTSSHFSESTSPYLAGINDDCLNPERLRLAMSYGLETYFIKLELLYNVRDNGMFSEERLTYYNRLHYTFKIFSSIGVKLTFKLFGNGTK